METSKMATFYPTISPQSLHGNSHRGRCATSARHVSDVSLIFEHAEGDARWEHLTHLMLLCYTYFLSLFQNKHFCGNSTECAHEVVGTQEVLREMHAAAVPVVQSLTGSAALTHLWSS